jgi:ATP-binding cassette subfamily B protein
MAHPRHTELPSAGRNDFETLRTLWSYLQEFRGRIWLAMAMLVLAKLSNVGVPIVLKTIIDRLEAPSTLNLVAVPLALIVAYGVLRFFNSAFQELRSAIFARASERSVRNVALSVFRHLHALSLRFHLDRRTGGLSRDVERGSRSISQLLHYLTFNIVPTVFEILLVCGILLWGFDAKYAIVTFVTVVIYAWYTVAVTNWRIQFRVRMNEMDSKANTAAIDSLINYETVKYFGNEEFEAGRYDKRLAEWEKASVQSQVSLSLLNVGQGIIIGAGLTVLMIFAAREVSDGSMTLGDFVMINAFLIQLYIPLNFLGTMFREIKHCLTDMERMFRLLDVTPEVAEKPEAPALRVEHGAVRFEGVNFAYRPDRPILHEVDFEIPAGKKVAVVGASGAGKSTLARLLFRFYDVTGGAIRIDGQDIRDVKLDSLRSAIGVVPQDTVLFNDSIEHNIRYGRPQATRAEVEEAARLAHLDTFVAALPQSMDTMVGERGLKLSGGEKQRVAIARTILKNPPILILDEATSSLDSKSEKAIQAALAEISERRTTLVIAHRLSTIIDADQILVMDHGRIVERGTHAELLRQSGPYAELWRLQLERPREEPAIPATEKTVAVAPA